jgi:DMSO/TMAO reductase YedYZ molybdopterin-dependent catalytic subunit
VLTVGPTPEITPDAWLLSIDGAVREPYVLSWSDLLAHEQTTWTGDVHCVTRWSKFGMRWRGVSVRELIERASPHPRASYLMAHCSGATPPTFRSQTCSSDRR